MKTFKELLEAKGLKASLRASRKDPEAMAQFAMRQGVRAAEKALSGSMVPKVKGVGGKATSSQAMLAQFGVDAMKDPISGEYKSTPYTPTEDQALTGNGNEEKLQGLVKQSFVNRFKSLYGKSMK